MGSEEESSSKYGCEEMTEINFPDSNLRFKCSSGTDFLEFHRKNPNSPLRFGCQRGDCGTCAIKILEGSENLTKQSEQEKQVLRQKNLDVEQHRLACQCAFNGDVALTNPHSPTNLSSTCPHSS